MITFACAACKRPMRIADQFAGKNAKCPHCAQITPVPSPPPGAPKQPTALPATAASAANRVAAPDAQTAATLAPPATASEGANTIALGANTLPNTSATSPTARIAVPGFEILGELGRGGMGVVYHARQLEPRRQVALKMVLSGEHASAEQLARFRAEATAAARLQHPNIVQVLEVREHGGHPFLTLEYVSGGSLGQLLRQQSLEPRQAAELVRQLTRAVAFAHLRGVVHRDLKPANVLLQPQGQGGEGGLPWLPKIADFGLAKHLEGLASVAAGPATASGAILGTPQYMAPEQVRGKSKEIGPAADVYALGTILYELLTGRPPFQGAQTLDILMQVATAEPVAPRQTKPALPRDLETICLKCLEKDPARRYRTAEELSEDLRRFLAGEPIVARPQTLVDRASRWVKGHKELVYLAGGAVAALLAVVVLLVIFNPFGRTPEKLAQNPPDNSGNGKSPPITETVRIPEDLQLIPASAQAFATLRVADVWKVHDPLSPAASKLWGNPAEHLMIKAGLDAVRQELLLEPQDVERCTIVVPSLDPEAFRPGGQEPVAILAFNKPYDWDRVKKFVDKIAPYKETTGQWTIYEPKTETPSQAPALYRKNDRVLVLGQMGDLVRFLNEGGASADGESKVRKVAFNNAASPAKTGPFDDASRIALEAAAGKHHFVLAVKPKRKQLEMLRGASKNLLSTTFLELQAAVLRLDFVPAAESGALPLGMDADLQMFYPSEEKASDAKGGGEAMMNLAIQFIDDPPTRKSLPPIIDALLEPLRKTPLLKRTGKEVTLTAQFRWKNAEVQGLVDWVEDRALRQLSVNNLQQMSLALNAYHDGQKRLPPPAIVDKKTGKPLLSWRVAILPYIEQDPLFNQFNREQPWDHPDNLKLLKLMPQVYRAPRSRKAPPLAADATETPYQAIVGPNTAFDPKQALTLVKIANGNGTGYTMAVVEAKKLVPWTKPEDINLDDQLLWPRLGGLFQGGFHGAMVDGAVHFFPMSYTERMLRALATYNDVMRVDLPKK